MEASPYKYYDKTKKRGFQMVENITKWLCRLLTKEQILFLISYLTEIVNQPNITFKKEKPNYPNYRKFEVDPKPPIPYHNEQSMDYRQLLKSKNIKPVKHSSDRKPPAHIRCPHCDAPSNYLYLNNGKISKSNQYKCKICSKTFCETPKPRVTKYLCPHCNHALYKWKENAIKTIYKCDNDKCSKYLDELEKLTDEEKTIQAKKPSQFKLRYNFRDYKISLKDINQEVAKPTNKILNSVYSMNVIGLILTFYISLGLSSRKTAFALRQIFGIKISHMSVIRIARYCSEICHAFNLKNIPQVTGEQAIDETYIKVKGRFHYVWLSISKFRSIITSYQVSNTRSEYPAIKSLLLANQKFMPSEDSENLTIIADGNPSYKAGQVFLEKEGIKIDLKTVVGLENKDETSTIYRYLKNLVERVNRTYKSYAKSCFGNIESASKDLALAVTDYNFLRPHNSLNYEPPVIMEDLKKTHLIQDRWVQILKSA